VDARYQEALEWVKSINLTTLEPAPAPVKKTIAPAQKKSEKLGPGRGGRRSPIVSNAIDDIISEGFLDKAKTTTEVQAELERKAVPGISVFNVSEALKRKARKGVLDRIKGAGKEYNYIKKAEKKT
jgi:hypothetical protein